MKQEVADKLERGLRRLERAGDDTDALGAALISLHGALEDQFRLLLAAEPALDTAQRELVQDRRRTQWKELLDLMQLHGDLPAEERRLIQRANSQRQEVAHGGSFKGRRREVEQYAELVKRRCGYSPSAVRITPLAGDELPGTTSADAPAALAKKAAPRRASSRKAAEAAAAPRLSVAAWGAVAALVVLVVVACSTFSATLLPPNPAPAPTVAVVPLAPTVIVAPVAPLPRGATVGSLDGLTLRVRREPSLAAEPLGMLLAEGERVAVVGGPVEADGYRWWEVELDGQRGWCAGAYLVLDE